MAEGTSLLRMHTAYTCIVGSNPTVSARIVKKPLISGVFFRLDISYPHLYPHYYFQFFGTCLAAD